ncbi:TetR/AcrR family transcriptional regulator [Variovorax boronicumulans]|uniref:TetR/AcrR family transcriptional regulator n=1 Tax=Variovorax boronicumulans TaxID=436515 RepID=UPI00214BFA20
MNAQIVDRAAGLFAKHGFDNTSLQQIADAIGYSKTGLLYRFPSKAAIYEAGFQAGLDHVTALLASVEGMRPGIRRDRTVIASYVDFTFEWPGVSAFANRLSGTEESTEPRLMEIALLIYKALGTDPQKAKTQRIVRITVAFSGLGIAAMAAVRLGQQKEWRSDIIESAMKALVH